jgi:hypothetical protein
MKCWKSAFKAQGSRVIIVVVRGWAVNIYVAVVSPLRKNGWAVNIYVAVVSLAAQEKRKTGWNPVYHQKNWWFSEFPPSSPLNANVFFVAGF